MLKLYYSIREVSELVDEEQHILRYWEKEFPQLKPKKNRGGNRTYSLKDIELLKYIKKLMRDDKLSLKGAKDLLVKVQDDKFNVQEFNVVKEMVLEKESQVQIVNTQIIQKLTEVNFDSNVEIRKKDLKAIYNLLKDTLELIKI